MSLEKQYTRLQYIWGLWPWDWWESTVLYIVPLSFYVPIASQVTCSRFSGKTDLVKESLKGPRSQCFLEPTAGRGIILASSLCRVRKHWEAVRHYHWKEVFSLLLDYLLKWDAADTQLPDFCPEPSATQLMMLFLLQYLFSSVAKPAKVCDLCHFCLQAINSPSLKKTILSLSTEPFEFLRGNKLGTCQLRDFLSPRVTMFHLLPVPSIGCLHMQLNS